MYIKQKLCTLLLVLVASVGMSRAEIFKVGDLYYKDSIKMVFIPPARIVYDTIFFGIVSSPENDRYAGDIVIPESVEHNGKTYEIDFINGGVFADCVDLRSISIPNSVVSIGNYIFSGCTGLTSATIPNSVTNVGEAVFYNCSNLTSIEIPEGVTSIGNYAFYGCSSLTSVTIPNSITSIGEWAFSNCSALTSIEIPNRVTSIGSGAFDGCCSLISVTIGSSVANIGAYAFSNCFDLTSVTCLAITPPELGELVFYNVDCSQIPLYVPEESIAAYQAANQWKDFANIQAISTTGLDQITNDQSSITNKVIRNGQILILRGDKTFTLTGQEIK